jgi:hypothetical protein
MMQKTFQDAGGEAAPALSAAAEAGLADEQTRAARGAVAAAAQSIAAGAGDELRGGIGAIIDGAAPDDAALLSEAFGLPKPKGKPRRTSDELSDDWRDGGYPYPLQDAAPRLRAREVRAADRAPEAPVLGEGGAPAPRHPVRGP